jgi:plastocyanin
MNIVRFVVVALLAASPALAVEPQIVEVKLDSFTITPARITVKANQPVTIKATNVATFIPHNLVIKAPEAGLDVRIEVRAGKTGQATFTPTQPGSYEMVCDKSPPIGKTHKERGMHGLLIVE